jgi:hypothetical protein
MPRSHRGTTSQAGYGWDHQKARARLIRALVDGTPCGYCGQGMWRGQALHADHSVPRVLGGSEADRLVHASCNLRAGARLGNRLRGARRHGHPVAGRPAPLPPLPGGGTPRLPEW